MLGVCAPPGDRLWPQEQHEICTCAVGCWVREGSPFAMDRNPTLSVLPESVSSRPRPTSKPPPPPPFPQLPDIDAPLGMPHDDPMAPALAPMDAKLTGPPAPLQPTVLLPAPLLTVSHCSCGAREGASALLASELPPSKLSIEGGRGADICALPWQLNTTPLTSQENTRLTAIDLRC